MTNVLQLDATNNNGQVSRDIGTPISEVWVTVDVAFSADYLTGLLAQTFAFSVLQLLSSLDSSSSEENSFSIWSDSGVAKWTWDDPAVPGSFTPATPITSMQFYEVEMHLTAGTPQQIEFWVDGVSVGTLTATTDVPDIEYLLLVGGGGFTGFVYFSDYKAGTSRGANNIYADDFSGDLSGWNDSVSDATLVADPGILPAQGTFTAYATTDELFRILSKNNPSAAQTVAAQGDIDAASIEINKEIDWAADHAAATSQELELMKGVCLDRAADLWRHRESAPGILGIVDEGVQPTGTGRYSWARYSARLSVLKDQWPVA